MYTNIKEKVVSPDGYTDYFQIYSGVIQGDTLALYLFVIVLDYAMRQNTPCKEEELVFTLRRRQSRGMLDICLTDFDLADDIALRSDEIKQARELLRNVATECGKVGLGLNEKKTKVMYFNVEKEDKRW